MAIIEAKEIGISFGVDKGKHVNTELVSGSIRLKKQTGSDTLYEKQGYWESDVIDIVGKFKEYDKIALTKTQFTNDLYKIETRTSDDGINFNDYIAITVGGSVLSPKKRYIQIKITLYAGTVEEDKVISSFSSPTEANEWDSEFIETKNGLRLKTEYAYTMTQDTSWSEEGTLLRQPIQNSKLKRIDSITLE